MPSISSKFFVMMSFLRWLHNVFSSKKFSLLLTVRVTCCRKNAAYHVIMHRSHTTFQIKSQTKTRLANIMYRER